MKRPPSLQRKMQRYMFLFAVIPLCILLVILLSMNFQSFVQENAKGLRADMISCESDMQLFRSQTESAMRVLSNSEGLSQLMQAQSAADWTTAYNGTDSAYDEATRVEAYLSSLSAKVIMIFRDDENRFSEHWATLLRHERYLSIEAYARFAQSADLSAWCGLADTLPVPVSRSFDFRTFGKRIVYYCRPFSPSSRNGIILECALSTEPFIQSVTGRLNTAPCILASGGDVIYSQGDIARPALTETLEIEGMGLSLTVCVPYSQLVSSYLSISGPILLLLLFAVAVLFLVFRRVLRHLLMRMEHLAVSADALKGEETIMLPEDGDDEIGRVIRAINRLLGRIEEQNQERVREEKDKRRNQALALQYQLNPHFLFNSLLWVQMEMERQSVSEETADSVALLGRVLRYNLTNSLTATLLEELDHLRAYTAFMSEMKQENIDLCVTCDDSLLQTTVPRFILQPIVENALQHGLIAGRALRVEVEISVLPAREDRLLCLRTANNGRPISQEQCERIRDLVSHPGTTCGQGYGLVNLFQRLSLNYTDHYRADVNSTQTEDGVLTVFTLWIPLDIQPSEGENI